MALVGTIVAFYSVRVASERDRAQREAATATEVADFLVDLFEAADPTQPAEPGTTTVRDLLDRGAERIQRELAGQAEVQDELFTVLGRVYTRMGLYDQARALVGTALEHRQARGEDEPSKLADSLEASAWIDYWTGALEAARTQAARALEYRRRAPREDPRAVATLHHLLGRIDRRAGEFRSSREHLAAALEIRQQHLAPDDLNIAATLQGLGSLAYQVGELDEAIGYNQRVLEIYERTLHEDDVRMASVIANLAQVRMVRGEYDGLEALLRRVLRIFEGRFGPHHREVGTAWLTPSRPPGTRCRSTSGPLAPAMCSCRTRFAGTRLSRTGAAPGGDSALRTRDGHSPHGPRREECPRARDRTGPRPCARRAPGAE